MIEPDKKVQLCRYCGGALRKRTEALFCYPEPPRTEAVDSYSGRVTKLAVPRHRVGVFRTKAELQKVVNEVVVSVRRAGPDGAIDQASTWDGTYTDEFFCTAEHARLFAYVYARAGYQTKAYADAVAKQKPEEANA